MREYSIFNPQSEKNLHDLKIRLEAETLTLREISIRYNPSIGLPAENEIDEWPVKLVFIDQQGKFVIIRFWSLTVGYGGTGPSCLEEILKYLKVDYKPDDIFTKQQEDEHGFINLHYEF